MRAAAPGVPIDHRDLRVLADGAGRAREVASRTVAEVYDRVGFLPAARA